MRRVHLAVALAATLAATAGCGTQSQFEENCAAKLTYDGTTYVEAGFSTTRTKALGKADILTCSRSSNVARVRQFPKHDAKTVIAVVEDDGKVRVFFAETLTDNQRQQLIDDKLLNAGDQ